MIQRLSHTTVYVLDQDSAQKFYVDKLGFEIRNDQKLGDFRWLTVGPKGQPDLELVLMPIRAGQMLDEATASQLRELVKKGTFGCGVLQTDDCKRTFEELKAKGVVFTMEPTERFYGIEALFKDDSGNWFSMTQRKGA